MTHKCSEETVSHYSQNTWLCYLSLHYFIDSPSVLWQEGPENVQPSTRKGTTTPTEVGNKSFYYCLPCLLMQRLSDVDCNSCLIHNLYQQYKILYHKV